MSPSPVDTSLAPDERLQRRLRETDESRWAQQVLHSSGGTVGPEGPAGTAGSQIRFGTGVPSNALGINGDYYLDTVTDNLYYKSGGTYAVAGNLKGSAGAAGAAGLTWKGTWSSATEYVVNDAVTYKGSSWRAKATNKAKEPPEATNWEILAEGGAATTVEEALSTKGVGYVKHGAVASTARPTGFKMVIWEGIVEPTNATAEDLVVYENSAAAFVPTVRAYKSGQQEITTGVVQPLTFDGERWDVGEAHSTVTNTGRLTAPTAGVYSVTGYAAWPAEITNPWFLAIRKNGSVIYGAQWQVAAFQSEGHVSAEIFLEAGEYVELVIYQNQGKTVKTAAKGTSNYEYGAEFSMTRLGSGTRGEPTDWGILEALPSGAIVGDTCTFKAAAGVFWKLQYTGEATYPWVKIGGPPLYVESNTEKTVSAATYVEESSTKLTTPLAMEADLSWGTKLTAAQETKLTAGKLGVFKGSTEIDWVSMAGSQIFDGAPQAGVKRAAVAKGESVNVRYQAEVAGANVKFVHFYLKIDPVRVG